LLLAGQAWQSPPRHKPRWLLPRRVWQSRRARNRIGVRTGKLNGGIAGNSVTLKAVTPSGSATIAYGTGAATLIVANTAANFPEANSPGFGYQKGRDRNAAALLPPLGQTIRSTLWLSDPTAVLMQGRSSRMPGAAEAGTAGLCSTPDVTEEPTTRESVPLWR
jgi:hypothetical protein